MESALAYYLDDLLDIELTPEGNLFKDVYFGASIIFKFKDFSVHEISIDANVSRDYTIKYANLSDFIYKIFSGVEEFNSLYSIDNRYIKILSNYLPGLQTIYINKL